MSYYFTITFLSTLIFIFCYYNVEYQRENIANRAKQKYIHRMGPTSFSRIHAELVYIILHF